MQPADAVTADESVADEGNMAAVQPLLVLTLLFVYSCNGDQL